MNRVTNMTEGKPLNLILNFTLPLILTNMGQQFYMIADASIVGRGVGVKALASVGATDWSYWLILWTVSALTQGFGTFISRYFGENNYRKINKSIAMSAILCALIGTILTVVGLIAVNPLLKLLKTPYDIIGGAAEYLNIMIAGTLVVTAYNMAAAILRALGDGKTPLIAMIIAAILNIALDLLFVFIFEWGIAGAAAASVAAQLVSFLFCLFYIKKIKFVEIKKEYFIPDKKVIKRLLSFGLPLALQHTVIAFGGMILQSTINMQGSIFLAGYTACNKLYGLLESTAVSLGFAVTTYAAQNYGAGNKKRVRDGVGTSIVLSVIMASVVAVIMIFLGKFFLQLFISETENGAGEALQIAFHYLKIMALNLVILYLLHVYKNSMQALGNSFWSMLSGFVEFGVRASIAKLLVPHIGSEVLFYIEPAAWLCALLCIMIPYYFYRQKLLQ